MHSVSDSSHISRESMGTWTSRSTPGHFSSWHSLDHVFCKPQRGLNSHEQVFCGLGFFSFLNSSSYTLNSSKFFMLPTPRTCAKSHKSQLPPAGGAALSSWICLLLVSLMTPIFRFWRAANTAAHFATHYMFYPIPHAICLVLFSGIEGSTGFWGVFFFCLFV